MGGRVSSVKNIKNNNSNTSMIRKENAKMTVAEYMDYATAHGIGRVKNSPYIILKIFWVLAVLGSIVIVAVQLSRLTDKWKSYPISTSIGLETHHHMRFPAVTICNLNPLRYSFVRDDAILMSAVQVAADKWNISLDKFEGSGDTYNGKIYNITGESDDFDKIISDDSTDNMIEYFRIKMSAENPDFIGNLSHQLNDLLVSCTFNGVPCKPWFFTRSRSYEYGMCYIFGLKWEELDNITQEESLYKVHSPGKDYGLTMILNAEQEEYLPFITDSAGLIVNIHSPDSKPWSHEHGVFISPGFNTEIAVEIKEQERIPGRNKRCDESNKYDNLAECRSECFTNLVPSRCGCSINIEDFPDYDYPGYDIQDSNDSTEYDTDAEEDDYNYHIPDCKAKKDTFCILRVRNDLGSGRDTCENCLSPCRQTSFTTSVTTTKWPALRYRPVLEKILDSYSSKRNFTTADVNDNLAQVTIYLPSFTKQKLTEGEAYSDENYVSDIGGQLGLWIGFSVLSLCELVELVILIVSSFFTKKVNPEEKQN